jgi:hypothetical protein
MVDRGLRAGLWLPGVRRSAKRRDQRRGVVVDRGELVDDHGRGDRDLDDRGRQLWRVHGDDDRLR